MMLMAEIHQYLGIHRKDSAEMKAMEKTTIVDKLGRAFDRAEKKQTAKNLISLKRCRC